MINLGGKEPTSRGPTNIEELEDIARREIQKKEPPTPRRRVFLSFRGEDRDLVNLFRGQAKNENSDIDFIDLSLRVPFESENAEYIRRGIRERIKSCSVTIVLVSETTHESEWVDWEIRESIKLGKGVIAVKLRDEPSIRKPPALTEYKIELLPWDQQKISRAIQEAAKNR